MNHGSLFSGIGGFDLAAEWMGWENVFHCEWMPFPRKVLHHYWPNAASYHDITTTDFTAHAGQIDILTGGFPCQPYSSAGKRKGKDDDRHLWPHMLRVIREVRPRWVVGENVFGLVTWNGGMVFEEVCAELEAEGYAVQPFILPAAAVNAPHRRHRVWFVAYAINHNGAMAEKISGMARETIKSCRIHRSPGHAADAANSGFESMRRAGENKIYRLNFAADANGNGLQGCISADFNQQQRSAQINASQCIPAYGAAIPFQNFPTQSPICGGDDGLPTELDGITFPKWRAESIKGYGNAIVPQVALQIFRAIEAYELS